MIRRLGERAILLVGLALFTVIGVIRHRGSL